MTAPMTLDEALAVAQQDCPLPVLGGRALKVLCGELDRLKEANKRFSDYLRAAVAPSFQVVPKTLTSEMAHAWNNLPPNWAGTLENRYRHMLMHVDATCFGRCKDC